MANPTPWPEIQQHVQRVTYVLNGACDAATQAQTIVARRWRERRAAGRVAAGRHNAPPAPFTRTDVARFFSTPGACTATGKLDGTNVGIDTEGALFGRRTAIPEANDSYQKTPLASLRGRGAQVAALRAALASAAGMPELEALPLMLYGELCVHKLYEYESSYASGAFKSWRVFGAAIQVELPGGDDDKIPAAGLDVARRLAAAGYRARAGCTVVVSMCDKLRALVDGVNTLEPEREPLTCVGEMGRGSLVEIVGQALTWMLEMRGEGLVLTYPAFGARSGGGLCTLGKWKCAQEPQQKNIQELSRLQHRFSEAGDFPPSLHFLLPAGVVDMVAKMHAVATAGSASPFKVAEQMMKQKPKKAGEAGPSEQDIAVQEAIASALTKFDSPGVYFDRNERKEFTALLLEEVLTDLTAEKGSKLKKLVSGAVMKRLGQDFGSWKRANAEVASATT